MKTSLQPKDSTPPPPLEGFGTPGELGGRSISATPSKPIVVPPRADTPPKALNSHIVTSIKDAPQNVSFWATFKAMLSNLTKGEFSWNEAKHTAAVRNVRDLIASSKDEMHAALPNIVKDSIAAGGNSFRVICDAMGAIDDLDLKAAFRDRAREEIAQFTDSLRRGVRPEGMPENGGDFLENVEYAMEKLPGEEVVSGDVRELLSAAERVVKSTSESCQTIEAAVKLCADNPALVREIKEVQSRAQADVAKLVAETQARAPQPPASAPVTPPSAAPAASSEAPTVAAQPQAQVQAQPSASAPVTPPSAEPAASSGAPAEAAAPVADVEEQIAALLGKNEIGVLAEIASSLAEGKDITEQLQSKIAQRFVHLARAKDNRIRDKLVELYSTDRDLCRRYCAIAERYPDVFLDERMLCNSSFKCNPGHLSWMVENIEKLTATNPEAEPALVELFRSAMNGGDLYTALLRLDYLIELRDKFPDAVAPHMSQMLGKCTPGPYYHWNDFARWSSNDILEAMDSLKNMMGRFDNPRMRQQLVELFAENPEMCRRLDKLNGVTPESLDTAIKLSQCPNIHLSIEQGIEMYAKHGGDGCQRLLEFAGKYPDVEISPWLMKECVENSETFQQFENLAQTPMDIENSVKFSRLENLVKHSQHIEIDAYLVQKCVEGGENFQQFVDFAGKHPNVKVDADLARKYIENPETIQQFVDFAGKHPNVEIGADLARRCIENPSILATAGSLFELCNSSRPANHGGGFEHLLLTCADYPDGAVRAQEFIGNNRSSVKEMESMVKLFGKEDGEQCLNAARALRDNFGLTKVQIINNSVLLQACVDHRDGFERIQALNGELQANDKAGLIITLELVKLFGSEKYLEAANMLTLGLGNAVEPKLITPQLVKLCADSGGNCYDVVEELVRKGELVDANLVEMLANHRDVYEKVSNLNGQNPDSSIIVTPRLLELCADESKFRILEEFSKNKGVVITASSLELDEDETRKAQELMTSANVRNRSSYSKNAYKIQVDKDLVRSCIANPEFEEIICDSEFNKNYTVIWSPMTADMVRRELEVRKRRRR